MALYTPTAWVNDQAPAMSAANLNKLTNELEAQASEVLVGAHTLPNWTDGAAPAITDAAPWNEMERITQLVAQTLGLTYTKTVWESGWTPARNAARLNQLEQQVSANRATIDAGVPSTGELRWRPPGWNGGDPTLASSFPGYTVRTISSAGTHTLTNGVDYYLEMGTVNYSGDTRIWIEGGRNIVLVGGTINYTNTSGDGFNSSLQFQGGDTGATLHVEGLQINNQPNGFTLKTPKLIQLQNNYLFLNDGSGVGHPDVIQVWSGYKSTGIRVHKMTAYSFFTWFADHTDDAGEANFGRYTPAYWELYDVDLHPISSRGIGHWLGSPNHAVWRGSNVWAETSTQPDGVRRDMGDLLRFYGLQYPPVDPTFGYAAQFRIYDTNGTTVLYTSPLNPKSGTPDTRGQLQGHWFRYADNPRLANIAYRTQIAPQTVDAQGWGGARNSAGNFVPKETVGASYVSPRYM